ncbi:glycosyltransferase, partial [Halobacillus trueperi]
MSQKRILFTGGGTAGHVIVNLALIPEFQKQGYTVDYIGSYSGIERKLIEPLDGVT